MWVSASWRYHSAIGEAMNEREQRQFIHFLVKELKNYVRELMAYQLCLALLKKYPAQEPPAEEIEKLLIDARKSPALQAQFEKQFDGFDEILPPADPEYSEMVKELLVKWKPPEGSPN
jgi:hypothetical protein